MVATSAIEVASASAGQWLSKDVGGLEMVSDKTQEEATANQVEEVVKRRRRRR